MKKSFYIGSIVGGNILGMVLLIVAGIKGRLEVVLLGLFMLIYAMVVVFVMWYKAWQAIQDGHARTTSAKAIGFLFIPIFNIYWCFQAFWGFAKDYNSYISRHGISVPKLPSGLFLAFCIFCLVSPIWVGFTRGIMIMTLIYIVIISVIANKICDGVNTLSEKVALDVQGESVQNGEDSIAGGIL